MIELTNLTCLHGRRPAVHHLCGRFVRGSMTAIVGPNGAGKTTLLRSIAGLHREYDGHIKRNGRIALLPQAPTLDRNFPITCAEVVAMGDPSALCLFAPAAKHGNITQALETVGLIGFSRRLVGTLSAGQFQRLLFARMMMQEAPVLLLDEPFSNVDARTLADLMRLLHRFHSEGRTIVAVLHDLDLVAREFPRTLLLAREKIAWDQTLVALSAENRLRARLTAEAWVEDPALCRTAA
jgi:zinc/manganese transport system ATP-binding protein